MLSLQAAERTLVPSGFCNDTAAIGHGGYWTWHPISQGYVWRQSRHSLCPSTQGAITLASSHSLQNKRRSWSSDITIFKGLQGVSDQGPMFRMIMPNLLLEVAHFARGCCIIDGARSLHQEEIISLKKKRHETGKGRTTGAESHARQVACGTAPTA